MMRELRDFVNNYGFFYNDHNNEKLWGPLISSCIMCHVRLSWSVYEGLSIFCSFSFFIIITKIVDSHYFGDAACCDMYVCFRLSFCNILSVICKKFSPVKPSYGWNYDFVASLSVKKWLWAQKSYGSVLRTAFSVRKGALLWMAERLGLCTITFNSNRPIGICDRIFRENSIRVELDFVLQVWVRSDPIGQ